MTAQSDSPKFSKSLKGRRYRKFAKEDFDAIITGELTHYALWMEGELEELISKFFCKDGKGADFRRILLRRDGLNFQDKIEIVRAILPLTDNPDAAKQLSATLKRIEAFKANRNAVAHGLDVTENYAPDTGLEIEIVGRSGKSRVITITPESHDEMMAVADELLKELRKLKEQVSA